MYRVNVSTKKGTQLSSFIWKQGECRLGRSKINEIVLQGWRVCGVHAVLNTGGKGIFVTASVDAKLVSINGEKYATFGPFKPQDVLQISDYLIRVDRVDHLDHAPQPLLENEVSPLNAPRKLDSSAERSQLSAGESEKTAPSNDKHTDLSLSRNTERSSDHTPLTDNVELVDQALVREWRSKIHRKLFHIMDLRRVNISEMNDAELRRYTHDTLQEILDSIKDFPESLDKAVISQQVLAEAVGLGPLEQLIHADSVSEIMVNAADEIFYEEAGQLKKSTVTFTDDASVISAIERIVSPLGRRIDESSPMVDARLKDGSRVNAIIPPLALKGPSITIRKFMKERLRAEDLVNFGSVDANMVGFLETAIKNKKNVVISGGTGSGKTTLLNVLSNYIPDGERIVTVEDAAELKLYQPNLVSLEARPPNQEGKGAVPIRELVKNCLRMRPDRIVVGECRGGEALDMLQAMNTGHDGSLTTIHANSPRDCISRMEVLVLMSGMDLPVRAIREQITSAVDIIVQQTRFSCGSRKVTSITEVTGIEGERVQLSEIFRFRQTGYNENGKVEGQFEPTGLVPDFYELLRQRGIPVNMEIFGVQESTL